MVADDDATYDLEEEIDLSTLEPLIALPSSPGKVVPVREVAGAEVFQCVIGSSANPGLRDFAMAAMIVDGRQTHDRVSFDVNPTSRQTLETLDAEGYMLQAHHGGRAHPPGRLHGLHRDGPGPGDRPHQPAHDAAQLPRPLGHARRTRSTSAARRPRPRRRSWA